MKDGVSVSTRNQAGLANENQEQGAISSNAKVFGEFLAPTHTHTHTQSVLLSLQAVSAHWFRVSGRKKKK